MKTTRYYVQVDSTASPTGLWIIEGSANRSIGTDYQLIQIADDGAGPPVSYGPLFANPLNRDFFVAAFSKAGTQQVGYSRDGGTTMCSDPTLTALLTESGRYPILSDGPSQRLGEVGSTYHGQRKALVPVAVAFDRTDPTRVVIASPFGRLLTAQIQGSRCEQPTWRDISPAFNHVDAYLSSVQIADGTLFVGTQGQGLFALNNFADAFIATWAEPQATISGGSAVAILHDGHGDLLPWSRASVQLSPMAGATAAPSVASQMLELRSDANGQIHLPGTVANGAYAVTVRIANDGAHAESTTKFLTTVGP